MRVAGTRELPDRRVRRIRICSDMNCPGREITIEKAQKQK